MNWKQGKLMKRFVVKAFSVGLLVVMSLFGGTVCAHAAQPLTDVLHDLQGSGWDAVQMTARDQAANDGPRFRSAPAQTPFYESFAGDFVPQDAQTKLAIFSDDGCDVWIDGVKVLANKDKGQALPNLLESLHKVSFVFAANRTYRIKVDFSNTIYQGRSDIDGATLFAYSEESTSPTPTTTATPTPTPVAQSSGQLKLMRLQNGEWQEVGLQGTGGVAMSRLNVASTSPDEQPALVKVGGTVQWMLEVELARNDRLQPKTMHAQITQLSGVHPLSQSRVTSNPEQTFSNTRWQIWSPADQRWQMGSPYSVNQTNTTQKFRLPLLGAGHSASLGWDTLIDMVQSRHFVDEEGGEFPDNRWLEGLWSRNGRHKLELLDPATSQPYKLRFEHSNYANNSVQSYEKSLPEAARVVDVQNMVITEAAAADGNLDYVRYDPESDNPAWSEPSIRFHFTDADYQPGDKYQYAVYFDETSSSTPPEFWWAGGREHPVEWNFNALSSNVMSSTLTTIPPDGVQVPLPTALSRGVYGFDVVIVKMRGGKYDYEPAYNRDLNQNGLIDSEAVWVDKKIDLQSLRSTSYNFETALEVVDEEDKAPLLKFAYHIDQSLDYANWGLTFSGGNIQHTPFDSTEEQKTALSQTSILALDSTYHQGTSLQGPLEITRDDEISLLRPRHMVDAPETETEEAGEDRVIVMGKDDQARLYRDNKPKRLWPKNASQLHYQVYLVNGPFVPALHPHGGSLLGNWNYINPRTRYISTTLPFSTEKVNFWFKIADSTGSPQQIWDNLRGTASLYSRRDRHRAVAFQSMSHGVGGTRFRVSNEIPPDTQEHDNSPGWVVKSPIKYPGELEDYDLRGAAPFRNSKGEGTLSFYHALACDGMAHTNTDENIPDYVVRHHGALNAVGYAGTIGFVHDPSLNWVQLWTNCFYRRALAPGFNARASAGLTEAFRVFKMNLLRQWPDHKMFNVGDTFGYDTYKITKPNDSLIEAALPPK
jgi:hypothetical protein